MDNDESSISKKETALSNLLSSIEKNEFPESPEPSTKEYVKRSPSSISSELNKPT